MLNVNVIEFDGQKACINSYSDHPALVEAMNRQRELFAARFPNAIVKTERMSNQDTVRLVATKVDAWAVGLASEAVKS